MSASPKAAPALQTPSISFFERYLTAWVALCIIAGILLGQWLPGLFRTIGGMEVAQVNLPVGLLIWVMIIPMLIKIDFSAMGQVAGHWRGIGVTLFVNWLVKPFSMSLLGWIFVRHVFAAWLSAVFKNQIDWLPLESGGVRPTQGRTLAVMQVCGGSQSFNAVNQMRVLGRWMRMLTIPNQSSVAKAFMEFDETGRMKPSPYYDRVVDVLEELVKFTLLTRDIGPYLVDRYSERKESAAALSKRVNQRGI